MLPKDRDSNLHIRRMIQEESSFVDASICFFSGNEYASKLSACDTPDLVVFYGSFQRPLFDFYGLLQQIRQKWRTTLVAAWLTDDPYEFENTYSLPGCIDFVFTNDKNSLHYYHSPNVYHLALGAGANLIEVSKSAAQEVKWDFIFCGVGFDNRNDIMRGLRGTLGKYSTLIIGSQWADDLKASFFWHPYVPFDELITLYTSAKIVLNLSRYFDFFNGLYEIAPSTPAPRTFEVAAIGVFQLTFFDRPEVYEYFAPDEMAIFNNLAEFNEQVDRYLNNDELRQSVAQKAQKRVFSEHLYRHRLQSLIDCVFQK